MRFDVEIDDSAAVDRVEGLRHRAEHFRPLLDEVGEILEEGVARNFETQGRYFGKPWPQLAESTIERKAREDLPAGILRAKGKVQAAVEGGARYTRVAGKQVRTGSKWYVVRFHQGGTSNGVPARKLFGVAKRDRRRILELALRYMTQGAKALRGR